MEWIWSITAFLLITIVGNGFGKINFRQDKDMEEDLTLNPLSDKMIHYINMKTKLWKAGRNFDPSTSMSYIKGLMGALQEPWYHRLPERKLHKVEGLHIPNEFDSRLKWPNCSSIKEIRDQGSCGSCWAFAATEAMTDRYCIATKGTKNFRFSAQNLISCCGLFNLCGFGCWGGYPGSAWRYWKKKGIVSGGPYNSSEGCQPYEIPPCVHHVTELGETEKCKDSYVHTPPCHKKCQTSYSVEYTQDLHYGEDVYTVRSNMEQIQIEIMKNGPIEATMDVYDDFLFYKSGIYHHVGGGSSLGGHAIKIIGWGEENGTPYWTIANSWNYDWGDKGFFKIFRGKDECNIESHIYAGIPKI